MVSSYTYHPLQSVRFLQVNSALHEGLRVITYQKGLLCLASANVTVAVTKATVSSYPIPAFMVISFQVLNKEYSPADHLRQY